MFSIDGISLEYWALRWLQYFKIQKNADWNYMLISWAFRFIIYHSIYTCFYAFDTSTFSVAIPRKKSLLKRLMRHRLPSRTHILSILFQWSRPTNTYEYQECYLHKNAFLRPIEFLSIEYQRKISSIVEFSIFQAFDNEGNNKTKKIEKIPDSNKYERYG